MNLSCDKKFPILKKTGSSVCRLPNSDEWGLFTEPEEIRDIRRLEDIPGVFEWLDSALDKGCWVTGFISYEASPAFDKVMKVKKLTDFPLAYFCSYRKKPEIFCPEVELSAPPKIKTMPEISASKYIKNVRTVLDHIREGDTYQVNYTFRVSAGKIESPEEYFLYLFQNHPVPYSAFINAGEFKIISLSPELFIEKNGRTLISKPMKGTAKREPDFDGDVKKALELSLDPKNQAENVMIVDMVRNDLAKISIPTGVKTEYLFKVGTFPTVHQMVSEVRGEMRKETGLTTCQPLLEILTVATTPCLAVAPFHRRMPRAFMADTSVATMDAKPETDALPGLFEIFKALFPPASITGAPKVNTVEIINYIEKSPRKIYTGAIGAFSPKGDFCLNVAIRTLICEGEKTEFGVGSGIVADSDPSDEWAECLLKSDYVNFRPPVFDVIETMLWERETGFHYLEEHLKRAGNSQKYFCRHWNLGKVENSLEKLMFPESANFARVRLRISQNGNATAEFAVLEKKGWGGKQIKICVSSQKTSSKDPFFHHKTTNRAFYDNRYKEAIEKGFDEVIFMNEKDELTEGAISNIFLKINGKWWTTPLSSGLLPGIWRAKTIRELDAEEKIIHIEDLHSADKILIGNSVRGGAEGKSEVSVF